MKADFWHARWERGEIGWHRDETDPHLPAHWPALGVPPGAPVFVPLCGKSLDLCWLRGEGHPVTGVEVSPLAVADFFRENELTPRVAKAGRFERWEADGVVLLCGDFFDLLPADLEGVAAVYDRASLIALPPVMRQRYAEHLKQVLPARAGILLLTLDYPQEEMDGPPFAVSEEEVRRLYDDAFEIAVLESDDALAGHTGLQARGVTRLTERVYRLLPR